MVFIFTTGICLPGDCRNIQFEHHTVDKILVNNTIRTVTVNNNDICEIFCYKEPNCVSYNCGPEDSELKQCDLNNRSHRQASNTDFIMKEGYIYRSVLVSGKSNLWKTIVTVSLYIQVSSYFFWKSFVIAFTDWHHSYRTTVKTAHVRSTHSVKLASLWKNTDVFVLRALKESTAR